MTDEKLEIQYQIVNADGVIRYYVAGFENASSIEDYEWFFDAAKEVVIFKLYVRRASMKEHPE